MGYATISIKHNASKHSKINRKIFKPLKIHQKNELKGFKKHKHYHHNRKHKKNSPYSPIYKISEPYKPIYFSDQHKPYIQEQETKWLYQTTDDYDKHSEMKCSQINTCSNGLNNRFDNRIPFKVQEEYKSYIDSKVLMKLLVGEMSVQNSQKYNCKLNVELKQNKNIRVECETNKKEYDAIQLQLLSQIQKQFKSININNRIKQDEMHD